MDLAQQLEDEEGRSRCVYLDSRGFETIGVGRLVDKRRGGGLSNPEIDFLLANDIQAKTTSVRGWLPWVAGLNEARQAVLIGMAFQMGNTGLLGFKNTLAAIQRGDYAAGARGMLDSTWARQTPGRAQRMARQMKTGEWQRKE